MTDSTDDVDWYDGYMDTPRKRTVSRRLSREERANLAHALMHLKANKITDARESGGWYCGNKGQFIKRHIKAVAYVRSLLKANAKAEVSE